MTLRRCFVGVLAGAALALGPVDADALGPGSTVLVSRPTADPLPAGAVNSSGIVGHGAVSEDGRYVAFSSQADGLLVAPSPFEQVLRLDRLTGHLDLVSATPAGAPGGGDSNGATISADGTRVAYSSSAPDLAAEVTDGTTHVFMRSMAATTSQLVSRASNTVMSAGAPANGESYAGQISADGSTVAFVSFATNLDGGDLSGNPSVFVRHVNAFPRTTELVSRADGAAGASTPDPASGASISADGNVVTFQTTTGALDPGVLDANGKSDIYVRRLSDDVTRLVSRASSGTDPVGDGDSFTPAISGGGTIVAFQSAAANLTSGDGNGVSDIYRRSNIFSGTTGATALISRIPGVALQAGNGTSQMPAISADGATVAFTSAATDLLPTPDTNGSRAVFVRSGSTTSLLSRGPAGAPATGAPTFDQPIGALSGDGSVGVFSSNAAELSTLDDDDYTGVYAAGVAGGPVSHISRPPGLAGPFEGGVGFASLGRQPVSADGRFVAFVSNSDGLSTEDDDRVTNAFVRDVYTGATTLVSRAPGAAGAAANGDTSTALISDDGTRVVMTSKATNLDPADGDDVSDVYVRDLRTGEVFLADRAPGAGGAKADQSASAASIDADGSRIAFTTKATNLGGGGADGDTDIFVRDLATGETLLASRGDGAAGDSANATASTASLSADGNRVAFVTAATNLGDGDADAAFDVHLRDLAAGRTLLVDRADGADGAKANGNSASDAQISRDGNHVVFASDATNLAGIDASSVPSAYVRDLAASTTRLASRADGAEGASVGAMVNFPRISADGTRVIWSQFDGSLTGEAPVDAAQTFLRDLATGRTLLVSRGDGASGAPLAKSNTSFSAAISASGHCVLFSGPAPAGFVPVMYATFDFPQLYLRTVDGECAPAPPPPGGSTGPVGGGGTTTAPADHDPPAISALSLLRRVFAVGRQATSVRAAKRRPTPYGTELRFTLSERATVRIVVARELSGRRKGKRCVKSTRALRHAKRCTRLVTVGTLTRSNVPSGKVRVRFTGRIGRKALKLGRHRFLLTATDAAGNRSKQRTAKFRVARR